MILTTTALIRTALVLLIASTTTDVARAQTKREDRAATPPAVGDTAKDFELASIDGEQIKLSKLTAQGPVALLVLRGFPGYQCPICNVQVGEFLGRAKDFQAAGARVVFVYPGPSKGLKEHAQEFVRGKTVPDNFFLLLDPDYKFIATYSLRWDAPQETAYPSTFVINSQNKIQFAQISKSHGGRAKASSVLEALNKK